MATELATAYISLVPSMRGVQSTIAKEFAPVGATAQKSGADAGKKFGGGGARSRDDGDRKSGL